jgi:FKBP-type peptidyl-prolyl cis-trans isomerase
MVRAFSSAFVVAVAVVALVCLVNIGGVDAATRSFDADGWETETRVIGSGVLPSVDSSVEVHAVGFALAATGRLSQFWSTRTKPVETFTYRSGMRQVIRGWDEAVMQMRNGERARVTMRSDYAYGETGFPMWGIKPDTDLVFDIEIIAIDGVRGNDGIKTEL